MEQPNVTFAMGMITGVLLSEAMRCIPAVIDGLMDLKIRVYLWHVRRREDKREQKRRDARRWDVNSL